MLPATEAISLNTCRDEKIASSLGLTGNDGQTNKEK